MGRGRWTNTSYNSFATARSYSTTVDSLTGISSLSSDYSAQDLFKSRHIQNELTPFNVTRECCDSEEHPNTIPVILALDVTGSMGSAAAEVAKKLNQVMTELYDKVADVEFMIMGIGDFAYDSAPLQVSQFESDIRIAEQLDKIYFEGGGGGNGYESYTAAWYFGLRHTSLDCWKRGKRGIIITMGDEPLNPYLPKMPVHRDVGDNLESDIETDALYREAVKKFDIYHIAVNDRATCYTMYSDHIETTFGKYLDKDHLIVAGLDGIAGRIVNIIVDAVNDESGELVSLSENSDEAITW